MALTPGSIGVFAGLESPLAIQEPAFIGRSVAVGGIIASVLLGAAGCRSLMRRYRTADGRVRSQIRWFLWAGSIGGVSAGTGVVLFSFSPDILSGPREALLVTSVALAAALLPIACAIGILHHRLYDIDQLISRTFVYGSLVALVAGAYSAGLAALERVSVALTGESSDFGVVLTTLILVVTFEPIERRLDRYAERFKHRSGLRLAGVPPNMRNAGRRRPQRAKSLTARTSRSRPARYAAAIASTPAAIPAARRSAGSFRR